MHKLYMQASQNQQESAGESQEANIPHLGQPFGVDLLKRLRSAFRGQSNHVLLKTPAVNTSRISIATRCWFSVRKLGRQDVE